MDLLMNVDAAKDILSELEKEPITFDQWCEFANKHGHATVCCLAGQGLVCFGDSPKTVIITPLGQDVLAQIRAAE